MLFMEPNVLAEHTAMEAEWHSLRTRSIRPQLQPIMAKHCWLLFPPIRWATSSPAHFRCISHACKEKPPSAPLVYWGKARRSNDEEEMRLPSRGHQAPLSPGKPWSRSRVCAQVFPVSKSKPRMEERWPPAQESLQHGFSSISPTFPASFGGTSALPTQQFLMLPPPIPAGRNYFRTTQL